jgi:hypothetical protein
VDERVRYLLPGVSVCTCIIKQTPAWMPPQMR